MTTATEWQTVGGSRRQAKNSKARANLEASDWTISLASSGKTSSKLPILSSYIPDLKANNRWDKGVTPSRSQYPSAKRQRRQFPDLTKKQTVSAPQPPIVTAEEFPQLNAQRPVFLEPNLKSMDWEKIGQSLPSADIKELPKKEIPIKHLIPDSWSDEEDDYLPCYQPHSIPSYSKPNRNWGSDSESDDEY